MNMVAGNIVVLGAGLSGLVSCIELEKKGFSPILIDKNAFVGGRIETNRFGDTPLDVGFQVLLSNYPAVQDYLNLKDLNLKKFLPGAIIHYEGKKTMWGDPLRDVSFLFPTVFSAAGKLSDKLKINSLQKSLKKKSIKEIFRSKETDTMSYLVHYGFSKAVINNFFQPFFAGIFLEEKLSTSSRMFEFIFKLFAEGQATIPSNGMQAIPEQLYSKLERTTLRLGVEAEIKDDCIVLNGNEEIKFDHCIVSFPTDEKTVEWKSCENIYFQTTSLGVDKPIIGLFTHKNRLVNNYHFVTDILTGSATILSTTIIRDHGLSDEELVSAVKDELRSYLEIENLEVLQHNKIPFALPNVKSVNYAPDTLLVKNKVIYTGDYSVQGSINGAMLAGKKAAELIS